LTLGVSLFSLVLPSVMAWLGEVLFLGVDVGVGCRSVVMVVIGLVVVILDVGWVGRVQYAILAAFFCFLTVPEPGRVLSRI
jgi:hypothetical protein